MVVDLGVVLSGFLSGTFASMGIGGNSILIAYLTFFVGYSQKVSQGIGIFFFIPVAILSVFLHSRKKLIKWKIAIPYSLLGVVGTFFGFFATNLFDQIIISKIFGIMFLTTGLIQLFKRVN